jgi:malate dehydrogenase (oxaloacetate-decarboxylating)(NADP+)
VVVREGIARPIVLGHPDEISALASEHEIDLTGVQIIDPMTSEKRQLYAERLAEKRGRKGMTKEIAFRTIRDNAYFGLMMLETGDCDAVLNGITMEYQDAVRPALQVIDLEPNISRASGLMALIRNDKVYMFADTTVNVDPTSEELAEIALSSAYIALAFDIQPKIAMLSFSNFGSASEAASKKVAHATEILKKKAPELIVDGEMQADTALLPELLSKYYPFSKLKEEANVLIFPDLNSGNIGYKLVKILGNLRVIGPILMGLSKPFHVLHRSIDVNEIVDMTAIAVVNAQMGYRRSLRPQ